MRGKRFAALVGSLLVLGLRTAVLALPPGYFVTDIGDLGGEETYPKAISDRGHVVGYSDMTAGPIQHYRAFLWTGADPMQMLGPPDEDSRACDINNADQVAGHYGNATGFIWDAGTITPIGSFCEGGRSRAYGINDLGHVVGYAEDIYVDEWGEERRIPYPFLLRDGVMTNLGMFGGDPECAQPYALDVNNSGTVLAGIWTPTPAHLHLAVIWSEEGGTQILDYGGAVGTHGRAINERGDVAGHYEHREDIRDVAFLLRDGVKTDLPSLGGTYALAYGINDIGQAVGWSDANACVWEDGVPVDLNGLIPPDSGWTLREAYDINNVGQIIGAGSNSLGHHRTFLLTPIPEPATLALLAAGVGALWIKRRRNT